jgi:hypothetical protein
MSITIGSVTITKNPNYPVDWWPERFNQSSQDTADGGRKTYDNGPNVIYGTLIIRHVDQAEGDSLRTYLDSTTIFEKESFTVSPPANTNLGKGKGTAMQVFFNGGNSLEGVFTLVAPGTYDVSIPYREDLDGIPEE